MKIPIFVKDLMERSEFNFDHRVAKNPDYAVGYTINTEKKSSYGYVTTLSDEMQRLKKWVERQSGGEMVIISTPKETHYHRQTATVTIFDPIMQHLEKLIPEQSSH